MWFHVHREFRFRNAHVNHDDATNTTFKRIVLHTSTSFLKSDPICYFGLVQNRDDDDDDCVAPKSTIQVKFLLWISWSQYEWLAIPESRQCLRLAWKIVCPCLVVHECAYELNVFVCCCMLVPASLFWCLFFSLEFLSQISIIFCCLTFCD